MSPRRQGLAGARGKRYEEAAKHRCLKGDERMEETRAIARLPYLDVAIAHRRLPEEQAEELAISLRATPSFDAFARHLEAQATYWPWLAVNPLLAWHGLLQAAWRPWLERRGTPPGGAGR
jgi:hypothetical protein